MVFQEINELFPDRGTVLGADELTYTELPVAGCTVVDAVFMIS